MSAKAYIRVSLAVLALSAGAVGAGAKGLRDITGPVEIPPASYTAKQYVDSTGCVFVRAGHGGSTIWVPRVTRKGTPFCGQQPSRVQASSAMRKAISHAEAPVAVPVVPRRTAAPVAPAPIVTVAPATEQVMRRDAPIIPKGFRAAWNDGRLNQNRGPRTAEGDAQMARVWTNTVPMHLRAAARPMAPAPTHVMRASSNMAPAGGAFVQLGAFGVPANAKAALGHLRGLGLPGKIRPSRLGHRDVQIVLAGPFNSNAAVLRALKAVRAAGYGDAFLRR